MALAQIVDLMLRLSQEETSQLLAIVQARSGIATIPKKSSGTPRQGNAGSRNQGASGKSRSTRKKGNPSRKSQWVTNPKYQEYHRLKKVVEAQAKAQKLSFNKVSTPEKMAYDAAFSAWMGEKSSFRTAGKTSAAEQGSEMEQDQEEDQIGPSSSNGNPVDGNGSKPGNSMVLPPGTSWASVTGDLQKISVTSTVLPHKRSKQGSSDSKKGKKSSH